MKNNKNVYYNGTISDIALGLKSAGLTRENLASIGEILKENPEISKVLDSPEVDGTAKKTIINRIFTDRLEAACLDTLVKHNLTGQVQEIFCAMEDLYLEESKTVRAILSYAVNPPDEEQLKKMEEFVLSKVEGQAVLWELRQDPELVDGFTLEAEGLYYDYSHGGRMKKLLNHLTGR